MNFIKKHVVIFLLFFQGNCLEGEHSMHITLSAYQLNSWTDLLEKLLPAALAVASQEDVEFRQVLGCFFEGIVVDIISFVPIPNSFVTF